MPLSHRSRLPNVLEADEAEFVRSNFFYDRFIQMADSHDFCPNSKFARTLRCDKLIARLANPLIPN